MVIWGSRVSALLAMVVVLAWSGLASSAPTISGVFPSAGATAGTLTIGFSASGLDSSSTLLLNGQMQTTLSLTTNNNPNTLNASVPFSLISTPGVVNLVLTSSTGNSAPPTLFFIPTLPPSAVLSGSVPLTLTLTTTSPLFCDPNNPLNCGGNVNFDMPPGNSVFLIPTIT